MQGCTGIFAGCGAGLAAYVALAVGAPAMAAARPAAVGVNTDITWGVSQSDVSQEISLLKAAGVTQVRASVDLSGAEYSGPGQLNAGYLSGIDYAVQAAQSAGLTVLMELDRTPYWASADPARYTDSSGAHQYNRYYRYADPADYARIVSDLVNRYTPMGVHAYEAWNEPNNPAFWPSGSNAAEYAALLKAAYPAIKAADPSATVAMGGLMNQGSYDYLQGMYDAGAKGSYDVANFHVYPGDPSHCNTDSSGRPGESSFCLIDGLRAEMAANGDNAPVWITELGWSTCAQAYCVSESQQASYLIDAFGLLSSTRYDYVQDTFLYQMRNNIYDTNSSDWGSSLGMLNVDWTPKPAYTALQQVANGTIATPAAGPATTPPSAPATRASVRRRSSSALRPHRRLTCNRWHSYRHNSSRHRRRAHRNSNPSCRRPAPRGAHRRRSAPATSSRSTRRAGASTHWSSSSSRARAVASR